MVFFGLFEISQMLLIARSDTAGEGNVNLVSLSFTARASRMLDRNVKDAMFVIRSYFSELELICRIESSVGEHSRLIIR